MFYVFNLLIIILGLCLNLSDTIHIRLIPDDHQGRVVECDIPCKFTSGSKRADAEFYIIQNDSNVGDIVNSKSGNSIRILGSQEGQHYYYLLKVESLNENFRALSLLDRRSDIPWVMMPDMDKIKTVEIPKNTKRIASFVARNCEPKNQRNDYVRAIEEVIGVLSPSTCLNNTEWPQCGEVPCTKLEVIRNYKFHLAFESANFPGFVTEKIYEAMEAGVVPVYLGTRDVAEVVPKGSYIDASDFDTPYDVANYLKEVLDDEDMYNSYFEWKYKPFDAEFKKMNQALWTEDHYCRVCYYVDAMKRGVGWDHQHQRAVDRIGLKIVKKINKKYKIGRSSEISKERHSNRFHFEESFQFLHFNLYITLLILLCVIVVAYKFRKYRYIIRLLPH